MTRYLIFLIILFSCKKELTKEQLFERDRLELVNELEQMISSDQKYRESGIRWNDSIAGLQKEIDVKNLQRLITIINTYGFPNVERLKEPLPAWIILQHTPNEYKNEVKDVVKKEFKAKRLPNNEYQILMWHLNGREGSPFSVEYQ